jgi:hypothetical protein
MTEIGTRYIVQALQEEVARLNENRIVLMAQVAQQADEIARLAGELSRATVDEE